MLSRVKAAFHQHLWQRLPRSWRRSALFQATALLAPRVTRGVQPSSPIIVAGALRTNSGLGESARLCEAALRSTDQSVYGIDLTAELMQPVDQPNFAFADGRDLAGPGTLILHVNAPLVPLALWRLGQRLVRNKYVIGYWAWELPKVPPDWLYGVPFVHEIWAPSTFIADALRPVAQGRPVRVVPHPVALRVPPAMVTVRPHGRPFTVLSIFNAASSIARKNPLAAVTAFRLAFGNDATSRLVVKIANASAFSAGLASIREIASTAINVVLIEETLSVAGMDALFRECDVVMSMHRSEGFGLTLAEAMLRGLPVVATDWSGNVDFLKSDNGVPIPYRLIAAEDPQGTYHHPEMSWADADVEAAAATLRRLREEPEWARRLGQRAASYGAEAWSARAYEEAVRRHLDF